MAKGRTKHRVGGATLPELPPRETKARWDIQGLRAFAVLAVVVDHLTGWPGGGFVGVDIFFVLSGFLITGLLLREHERTNHISFLGFYRRRAKRILPASTLVILATLVGSYAAFANTRFEQVKTDSVWALLFSANWHYATERTDYFNADRAISPLQHYWSLGIEEQFYFVWPWLMLGIFALLLRRNRSRATARVVIGLVIGVVVVASFAWACLQTQDDAKVAYFSTFTRVWELGFGALLAVATPLLMRVPGKTRPLMSWVGLAGMVTSLWVVSADGAFPAPAAALPVLATGLVIAGGTFANFGQQQRWLFPLTNRGSNYIGDISYSLYLWHFPVIIIGGAQLGDTAVDRITLAVAMTLLSVFSYHLVENPLRRNRWSYQRVVAAVSGTDESDGARRWGYGATAFLATVTAMLCAVALWPTSAPVSALQVASGGQPGTPPSETTEPHGRPTRPEAAKLQNQIRDALLDTTWPEDLAPSMDQSFGAPIAPDDILRCAALADELAGPSECSWGPVDAAHTAVLVGDSVAIAYADSLRKSTLDQGWRFLLRVTTACPFVDVAVNVGEETFNPDCPAAQEVAVRDINAVSPDVLFVVNHRWAAPNPNEDWVDASERQMAKTGDAVGRVVYVGGIPQNSDPAECFTPSSSPVDCTGTPSAEWRDMVKFQGTLADSLGGILVNSESWFCYERLCPPYVGSTPTRPDAAHVLPAYMAVVQPVMAEALKAAGVWRRVER